MTEIAERLRKVIVGALRRTTDPADIKGENLIEELGLTSVDALEVLIWVESEFGIEIHDSDLSQQLVSSLENLERYIIGRLAEQASA